MSDLGMVLLDDAELAEFDYKSALLPFQSGDTMHTHLVEFRGEESTAHSVHTCRETNYELVTPKKISDASDHQGINKACLQ